MAIETAGTLTWAQAGALNPSDPICLSCGGELAPTLARLASLRCHDCRDSNAPINAHLIRSRTPRHSPRLQRRTS
jgi:hypothetical protein